jgi:uncharacterized protein (DUF952 family)
MIYHIVTDADYRSRNDGQQYLPSDFVADGFVHCALEASVLAAADDYYAGVSDTLLLLKIDPTRLKSPTRYEAASLARGAGTLHVATSPVFPHVYGPINNTAIGGIGILTKGEHGYGWPTTFISIAEYFGRNEAFFRLTRR